MPKTVGIALHRWYNPELAKLVTESGRPCEALAAARTVNINPESKPRLISATPPKEYFDYLSRNLNLIAVFSGEEIARSRKAGASNEALLRILQDAEKQAEPYKGDLNYPIAVKKVKSAM
jgi:hypothetical protein